MAALECLLTQVICRVPASSSGCKSNYCAAGVMGGHAPPLEANPISDFTDNAPALEAYPPTGSVSALSDRARMLLLWNPNLSQVLQAYLTIRMPSFLGTEACKRMR